MPCTTIDEVLASLDAIIHSPEASTSCIGYFPALYRKVTAQVKIGIASGRFQDGPRMERMDVAFANRYLDAYECWRSGRPVTGSWRAAFEAAQRWKPTILQHLLAGMNAHINLDLGIAAAEICTLDDIEALRHDFDEINNILFAMVQEVTDCIGSVSPWMWILDKLGGRTDDKLIEFSIWRARAVAWQNATGLVRLDKDGLAARVVEIDDFVEGLGRFMLKPGPMMRLGLFLIRLREPNDPRKVLAAFC
ncbi:DUF5995 family protein [Paludibaculum fermentans]|uniref:Uncharacterized protein n=1 Tax=Paludibaculum fermentans TaxID=1473598 RepID=A0A7S7SIH0_PALFE|nr:DUF5995 family protein [Paludibaculum fermentans]QOY85461.1 hypothetical protein IRI77_21825 [Paludibaculum fermentans]